MQICLLHLQRGYFVWFLGRKNPKTNPTHTHKWGSMSGKIISQLWLKMFWLSLSDLHTKNALKASHSECEHQEERGLLAMFSWVKLIMALWNLYSWQGKYGKFYKRFKKKKKNTSSLTTAKVTFISSGTFDHVFLSAEGTKLSLGKNWPF